MWGAMGVVDFEGNSKPVKENWDNWLARKIREVSNWQGVEKAHGPPFSPSFKSNFML